MYPKVQDFAAKDKHIFPCSAIHQILKDRQKNNDYTELEDASMKLHLHGELERSKIINFGH